MVAAKPEAWSSPSSAGIAIGIFEPASSAALPSAFCHIRHRTSRRWPAAVRGLVLFYGGSAVAGLGDFEVIDQNKRSCPVSVCQIAMTIIKPCRGCLLNRSSSDGSVYAVMSRSSNDVAARIQHRSGPASW